MGRNPHSRASGNPLIRNAADSAMLPLMQSLETESPAMPLRRAWLILALTSLVFAGVFALLVALARTPGIQDLFPSGPYSKVALVGHVVLSFIVWFLAFQGVVWAAGLRADGSPGLRRGSRAGLLLSAAGTGLIVLSAFLGWGQPVLANYIPILDHPVYLGGLALVGLGTALAAGVGVAGGLMKRPEPEAFGAGTAAVLFLAGLMTFALSGIGLVRSGGTGNSYEGVFWGGGHVLQAGNTAAMVTVWLILARATSSPLFVKAAWIKALLATYLAAAVVGPVLALFDPMSVVQRVGFTRLMEYGLGPTTSIIVLLFFVHLWKERAAGTRASWRDPRFSSLVLSLCLILVGIGVGLTIRGSDVRIPSHYHGAIGAVTMAFMGLTYHLIGSFGREPLSKRLAVVQPYLYTGGQVLFVLGLYWAGAHGVARKTFGAAQNLDETAKTIGMAVMGIGGGIAIIGGAAFVVNALGGLLRRPGSSRPAAPVRDADADPVAAAGA